MKRYISRRLLQAIPIVFGITVLTYLIMKLAPGGPLARAGSWGRSGEGRGF